MTGPSVEERPLFLATLSPEPRNRQAALVVVLLSFAFFLIAAAFAKAPLAPMPVFIAIYESALVINDLVTAVILFCQFHFLRSRALLFLASAYLLTALTAFAHALTFPGLFSPSGLLGAGPQSTAWLYMFWHGSFPLLVIAYACLKHQQGTNSSAGRRDSVAVLCSVGAVLVTAGGFALVATVGQELLPAVMQGNRYTPAQIIVISAVWLLNLVALVIVWWRRPHSVLDLWLMVGLCAWLFDIALSGVLNAARYDVGFYAGRIYGLLAASFVLVVLLLENSKIYAKLIARHESDRQIARELERLTVVDSLTGITNRRGFETSLDQEWRRAMRHKTPLSLLMIDVDYFKRFNDTYGHVAGDNCLRAIAKALSSNARRAGELAARYGGEEFAILLPHTDLDEANRLAQRICQQVRELSIPHGQSPVAGCVTISVGVASALSLSGGHADRTQASISWFAPTALVEMADQALYAAKTAGRNCAYCDQLPNKLRAAAQ
jgi:diguanylate cyclase (GGDEF)-like protein